MFFGDAVFFFYAHVKLSRQSQAEILKIKSHTGLALWKILNLGLLLQAPSRIGFLWVRSLIHLVVTQINPIPYKKEASSQTTPKARPDPVPFGLFTPPPWGSCCRVGTLVPTVGQQRMQSCAVLRSPEQTNECGSVCKDEFVWCEHVGVYVRTCVRHCNAVRFIRDMKANTASSTRCWLPDCSIQEE